MRLAPTSSVVLGLLVLARPVFSQGATWWVDKSCEEKLGKGEVNKMLEEVVDSAKLIRDRIIRPEEDEKDAHFAFEKLFKFKTSTADKNDQSRLRVFKQFIGGFTGVDSMYGLTEYKSSGGSADFERRLSKIRIHCDNGDRFELVKDEEVTLDDPKAKEQPPKNSERKPEDQEYFDTVNKIFTKGDVKCGRLTNKNSILMQTTRWSGETNYDLGKGGNELKQRASITMCDEWINMEDRVNLFEDLPSDTLLTPITKEPRESLHNLRMVGSMGLLHEITHTIQPSPTRDFAYSIACFALPKETAFMNADSYNLLAVIIRSMERRYALRRDFDYSKEKTGLKKYKDIKARVKLTKRNEFQPDWLLEKKDSILPCEDLYSPSGVALRCKKFVV